MNDKTKSKSDKKTPDKPGLVGFNRFSGEKSSA